MAMATTSTKKPEDNKPNIIDIKTTPIKYDKKDRLMRGFAQDAEFKKKHGDKWRQVASAITHVHTAHKDDTIKHL